jgi:Ferritin-like domain
VSGAPTRRALLGAAAALALAAPAYAQRGRSDVEILEELLALEARLAGVYEAALRRDAIDKGLGELLLEQEREHIRGLEQALRSVGDRAPRAGVAPPGLGPALRSPEAFAGFALELEAQAVAAYTSASAEITRPGLRRPLGSIMACESAHEVALRASAGLPLLAGAARAE